MWTIRIPQVNRRWHKRWACHALHWIFITSTVTAKCFSCVCEVVSFNVRKNSFATLKLEQATWGHNFNKVVLNETLKTYFYLHTAIIRKHANNNSQYLYRNVQFSKASLNGVLFLWVNFWGGRKPECPEETLEVRLRSTETQSTYNTCSRGGRREWCPLRQPDIPRYRSQSVHSPYFIRKQFLMCEGGG